MFDILHKQSTKQLQLFYYFALFTKLTLVLINIKREIFVTNGYRKEQNCRVTRVGIGSRAGCHHVEINAVEQKYIAEEYITENTLLKVPYRKIYIHYIATSDLS